MNSFHNYFTLIHKNQLSLLKPIKPEPFIPAPATEQTLLIPSIGNNPPEYIKINVPNIQVKVLPKQNFSLKPDVAVGDYSYVIMYPEATAEDPKKSVIEETLVEEVVAKNIPQDSQDLIEYYITGDVESQEGSSSYYLQNLISLKFFQLKLIVKIKTMSLKWDLLTTPMNQKKILRQ